MPPVDTQGPGPYKVLSTLADEVDVFWRDRPDLADGSTILPTSQKGYFLFEEHAESWAELFTCGLQRYRPLLTAAPADTVAHLASSRPDQVRERAWLVIYYGIILPFLPSTTAEPEKIRSRLRANLWLAFNDTRLLLEPSDPNIQALAFLACHVEPFTTPSLCWMLMSNACRMLRALTVNHKTADPETKERRLILFWHLNTLEKSMMLIFPWPGAFHRTMYNDIPLPTLNQILPWQPQVGSDKRSSLFGAHHMLQSFRLSRVMTDIWCALDENDARAEQAAKQALDMWYREATQVLEAASLAEMPFLDPLAARSLEFGLTYMRFQYYGALIVLTRGHAKTSKLCHETSLKMLRLLKDLNAGAEEPYIGVTWQMLYFPWAPFLVLFGQIMSSDQRARTMEKEKEQALEAMEQLPAYFRDMGLRYCEANKLERMAAATVQRARSVLYPEEAPPANSLPTPVLPNSEAGLVPSPTSMTIREGIPQQSASDGQQPGLIFRAPSSTLPDSSGIPGAGPWLWGDMDMPPQAWPSSLEDPLFADPVFDWFAWEGQT
ncbi:hypothetical protein B0A55_02902 [Friedmanniomyces simplex]|uniref:Xylanolytic transcriptional activator regulatory domain-containing protein n=1 Tax=Friedmanniomyces simplex TaxID=329884 RepID=A0A4U0XSI8_9PEZI|nr:hypothetical protein B0A55_02902 [Friedmanniomyces simplex]